MKSIMLKPVKISYDIRSLLLKSSARILKIKYLTTANYLDPVGYTLEIF